MKRGLYVVSGCLAVALAVVGIFVPGLPTTPFLLLASWLFYRCSPRLHRALHSSRWFGPYLRRHQSREGVGWRTKAISLLAMWAMISISTFGILTNWHARGLLLALGCIGTYMILVVVPNAKSR